MKRNKLIEKELSKHPDVSYEYEYRGRHPSVRIRVGSREKFVVFSGTKTDPRGERNKISQIRRPIAELRA